MKDGLGNWAEAASHIGTRTKEECEKHYKEVYLNFGPNGEDLDQVDVKSGQGKETGMERELEGPPRKKRRREFMPVSIAVEDRFARELTKHSAWT